MNLNLIVFKYILYIPVLCRISTKLHFFSMSSCFQSGVSHFHRITLVNNCFTQKFNIFFNIENFLLNLFKKQTITIILFKLYVHNSPYGDAFVIYFWILEFLMLCELMHYWCYSMRPISDWKVC